MKKKPISLSVFLASVALMFNSAIAAPVNINQANAAEIATALNGIGLKKAEAIVAYREQVGAFTSIEQLVEVKGIGEKMVSKIQQDILLETP